MTTTTPRRFHCYVAIGDSSTEGLRDPEEGGGYRGWSRRLAARIESVQGGLTYTNLGKRGATTREILEAQFGRAQALQPDLVTLFSGTNDVLRRHFDPVALEHDIETMQGGFRQQGATVLTFTLPDLQRVMPIARLLSKRIHVMNDVVRQVSQRTGAILLDLATYDVATDMRLWHPDRIHVNATGHTLIADAMAHALGLPDTDDTWGQDLPPQAPAGVVQRLRGEMSWTVHYLMPWIGKRILRRQRADRAPG